MGFGGNETGIPGSGDSRHLSAPSSALVIYVRGSGPVMKLHPLPRAPPRPARAKTHSRNYYATTIRALSRASGALVPPYANVVFFRIHQSHRSLNGDPHTRVNCIFSVFGYPLSGFVYAMKNLLLSREILIEKRSEASGVLFFNFHQCAVYGNFSPFSLYCGFASSSYWSLVFYFKRVLVRAETCAER